MNFSELTAVRRSATDTFALDIDPSAWVVHGPNGGYVAALLLRALMERVPDRPPRSLTVHYPASPTVGPATISTEIVRAGRSLVTASARLEQDGRPMAVALAAFSPAWTGPSWTDDAVPAIVPFEIAPLLQRPNQLPFTNYWDHRQTMGSPPFTGGARAEIGGWTRLIEPEPVDAVVVAAIVDAWPPTVFTRNDAPAGAPTIDLTIHFRTALPYPSMADDDPVLCRFTSRTAADGLFEEDGWLWSPDGVLLAQSRQLAILMPG